VELLIFDLGHVVVDFEWEEICRGFYTRSGHTADEFREIMAFAAGLGYEHGKVSTAEFLSAFNQKAGLSLSLPEFQPLWVATFRENPEMAELLQALGKHHRLYALSNTNEVHYGHLKHQYNIERHFEDMVLSYRIGYAKPELEIYKEVLERSHLPAERCLFIDDLPRNLKPAREMGMNTIQFCGVEELKLQLNDCGIL